MSLAILSKEIKAPGKSLLYLRLYWQIPPLHPAKSGMKLVVTGK